MNQQRQQDYLNLIQVLLDCPNGEEGNILNAHLHLIDADLVQVMAQVAEMMAQQGDENNARFLTDLAQQIAAYLGNTSSVASRQEYIAFLGEVLQATDNSNGNKQVVYPILAANQDKLNQTLVKLYPDFVNNILSQCPPEQAPSLAGIFGNFSTLIQQFPLGNRASNLEIAIIGYQLGLNIFNRDKFPQYWAMTQNNLGNAYKDKITGNRAQNIDEAINCYQRALEVYTCKNFPKNWATTQNGLGNAYSDKITGNRDENIDDAIACYQASLKVYTDQAFPYEWAMTQNNLGNAYFKKITGNRAQNIDDAIRCYNLALKVRTRKDFPEDWALTQNNLGSAYSNKTTGNRAENIDDAIRCYQASLEVYTDQAFPYEWARSQNNLGSAYFKKITGNRAENIDSAIKFYERALKVRNRADFPEDWAMTQNNLGLAYSDKITGNRAENIDKAIGYYQQALEVYTRAKFPEQWAMIQNNLGLAYKDKITGNQAENARNIDDAIRCYNLALEVRTRAKFPEDWADTQNNLGNAYKDKIIGNRAENIDSAIAFYLLALEVKTRAKFPEQWAMIQNNLGNAYKDKITGNRAENIDSAIASYLLALEVRTRADFPENWADTQNNLGSAYSDKITGNRDENIKAAIKGLRFALEIRKPEAFPLGCLQSGRNLGNTAFKAGFWEIAIEGYGQAIKAVEISRNWAMTDARRQEIIAQAVTVYDNIVQAYINLGQIDKAIAYVDRSRSKRLVDLMASNDLYAGETPPEVRAYLEQYDKLQVLIDAERNRLQNNSNSSKQQTDQSTNKGSFALTRAALEAATEDIEKLEREKQKVWEQMRRLDPVLAGGIQVSPLDFATIQQLIEKPHTAILNFFTTDNDTHIFIIYKDKKPQLHTCTGFGYQTLRELVVNEWLNPYLNKKKDGIWYGKISQFLEQLAEKLQIKTLVQTYLNGIEELIIIPHLYWHQIPFAALPLAVPTPVNSQPPEKQSSGMIRQAIEIFTRLEKKKTTTNMTGIRPESEIISTQYLGDKFRLRYVPSSQILQYCQQRPPLSQINYGTVENPDGSLPSVEFECEKIAQFYNIPANQRLKGRDKATVSNYRELAKQVQVLHSSHHASSRLDSPLESVLKLADGNITLGQIMTPGFRLPNLSDVFLSCCETNLGIAGVSDDILSLSTGFLCAGARSVVSTLWSVDDLATALFSVFYYQYRKQGLNRPEALRKAQITLRTLPGKTLETDYKSELESHFQEQNQQAIEKWEKAKKNRKRLFEGTREYQQWDEEYKQWDAVLQRIFKVKESLKTLCRKELPFAEPYYWAGFICSGLR